MKPFVASVGVLAAAFTFASETRAEDWPTYMHDNARSGVTAEHVGAPLSEQWVYRSRQAPQPAWPERQVNPDRVAYDKAYHVAVAGGAVYFGSSAEDKVVCLDAATGRQRWQTLVGGPVRLAPTVWQDRVFVGCDDGRAYCLGAADGRLKWAVRGAPNDRRLLGMGRMISPWPLRTGVLVADGTAYFTAGLFPTESVYVYALRADTGAVVWKNDTLGQLYVRLPHAPAEGFSGLSPQGPLLASAQRLYIPNGRNVPAALDRSDGRLVFWPWTHWAGGVWALLTGDLLISGGTDASGRYVAYDGQTGKDRFACFPGRRIVVTPDTSYLLNGSSLVAVDRQRYPELSRKEHFLRKEQANVSHLHRRYESQLLELRKKRTKTGGPESRGPSTEEQELAKRVKDIGEKIPRVKAEYEEVTKAIKTCVRWQTPCKGTYSLILAGGVLYAGGEGEVAAVDAATGEARWTGKVEGKAWGLAAAAGRLFVSTDSGRIYCFAKGGRASDAKPEAEAKPAASPYPADKLTAVYAAAAEQIVKETGVRSGYGLVLGCGTGRLAYELANRTKLHIIGIEDDTDKVRAARKALDAAGLYGARIAIVEGSPDRLPFASYFANLIVSDAMLSGGRPGASPEEIRRVLKPLGGVAYLPKPGSKGAWTRLTRDPPEGAGAWTHQYGDAGNSGCSTDRLVRPPFRTLWFGRPGPWRLINRHARGSAPVSAHGRLFIQGEHRLMALDAYNGVMLWQHDIQGARRVGLGAECSNLAASDESVFLAVGSECFRFDAATGEKQATYKVPAAPDGKPRQWGYVAWEGELLFGSSSPKQYMSDALFAVDRRTGKTRWVYRVKSIPNPAIAVGQGRVFLVKGELAEPTGEPSRLLTALGGSTYRWNAVGNGPTEPSAVLLALGAADGKEQWRRPFDPEPFMTSTHPMAPQGLALLYSDNRVFVADSFGGKALMAVKADDGSVLWNTETDYELRPVVVGQAIYGTPSIAAGSVGHDVRTGKRLTRIHPMTGQPVPWEMPRTYGCGTVSASPNCLFFRSGCVGIYDLARDGGTSNWGGMRPGCWINVIAAGGLVLLPEGSAYCTCAYPIQTTLALEPVERNEHWAVFSTKGATTPVRHWAINLGAPGDRRDADGTLWFAYPRPSTHRPTAKPEPHFDQILLYAPQHPSTRYAVQFTLDESLRTGTGFFRRNSNDLAIRGTDKPWVYASGCRGLTRCVLPLIGRGGKAADYTVKLGFAEVDSVAPGGRVFDIKLQGKVVAKDFDIVRSAGGQNAAIVKQFAGVRVTTGLLIELVPKLKQPTAEQAPILNGIQVLREGP